MVGQFTTLWMAGLLGAICALLCSRQANYIVGQSIVVDGGATNSTF